MNQERYPHLRRNAVCLGIDYVFFGIAIAFLNSTTVLPTLARRLTDSTVLVGLISTISTGGWLLPQLFAANFVAGRDRVKAYIIRPAFFGRVVLSATGVGILLFAVTNPGLALAIFFPCYLVFWLSDGIASVPWLDVLAKAIPPTRRGRLFGVSQIVYGATAIGIGGLVIYLLGPGSPAAFPLNYALLFFGAGLSLMISLAGVVLIREPVGQTSHDRISWGQYLPKLWNIVRTNPVFAQVMSGRLLVGFSTMAYAFYIIFAIENLGMSPGVVGPFTAAQTSGGILAGFVLGYLNERRGSVAVIRITVAMSLVIPVLALFAHFAAGALGPVLIYIYAIVFVLIGMVNSAFMLGFLSCIIEIAPASEIPIYVGLANTINSLMLVAPLIGGWLLRVGTYPLLFLVSALCAGLAFIPVWALAEPRTRVVEQAET